VAVAVRGVVVCVVVVCVVVVCGGGGWYVCSCHDVLCIVHNISVYVL